ncbi:hypothetical protein X777_00818 [Ooceraea biroi]|uniref:Uncharacterized protein n=1 Tax=Ooceraea biroi TaxID=2015173 RepID=A0A026WP40_OOCBI|nr:hypothetical protein X777_00818 [Ooceraea biroi]
MKNSVQKKLIDATEFIKKSMEHKPPSGILEEEHSKTTLRNRFNKCSGTSPTRDGISPGRPRV